MRKAIQNTDMKTLTYYNFQDKVIIKTKKLVCKPTYLKSTACQQKVPFSYDQPLHHDCSNPHPIPKFHQ